MYVGFVIGIGMDESYSILYWVGGSRSFIYRGFVIGTGTDESYTILY